MKLVIHSGETINVYAVDSVPVMIEINDKLVPTVCGLWKVPDLVPSIAIHPQVLSKVRLRKFMNHLLHITNF